MHLNLPVGGRCKIEHSFFRVLLCIEEQRCGMQQVTGVELQDRLLQVKKDELDLVDYRRSNSVEPVFRRK